MFLSSCKIYGKITQRSQQQEHSGRTQRLPTHQSLWWKPKREQETRQQIAGCRSIYWSSPFLCVYKCVKALLKKLNNERRRLEGGRKEENHRLTKVGAMLFSFSFTARGSWWWSNSKTNATTEPSLTRKRNERHIQKKGEIAAGTANDSKISSARPPPPSDRPLLRSSTDRQSRPPTLKIAFIIFPVSMRIRFVYAAICIKAGSIKC